MGKHKPILAFAAFTAFFAVLATFVFWGTWSPDVTPIMPDAPTVHALGYFKALRELLYEHCFSKWLFIPDDLLLFFGTPYFRQEFQYVFAAYFAALGAVYYCRGRGLGLFASYSAGLLLAFCGYWFTLFSAGHMGWFRWMTYGVFAFGLCDRAVRLDNLRHWLLLAAVLAWSCRWQQDMWLIFALFSFAYFVWCHFREKRKPAWRHIAIAAVAFFAIGGGNIRFAFVDSLAGRKAQLEDSKGSALSGGAGKDSREANWVFATNWSMPPEDTLEFFIPRIHGDTSCPYSLSIAQWKKCDLAPYSGRLGRPIDAKDGNYRQHSLYVGRVTCFFALVAVALLAARRLRTRDVGFFAAAALLFWLLSMGRFCESVYRVVFSLPLANFIRAPVKWHHATELSLVFLAAFSLDALWNFAAGAHRRWMRYAAVALVAWGALDLANAASRYCVPLDLTEVKRQSCAMDLVFLHDSNFSDPRLAAMVRARRIIPVANYPGRDDVHLVQCLSPRKAPEKKPPQPLYAKLLGLLSLVSSIVVVAYAVKRGRSDE